jgi:8-oxo-dGTP pyrophosphatase MutT (NUDIX family)
VIRIAVCLLVDARGFVLLQERDSEAPRSPDVWGMVGGHVKDGESFDEAVYREVAEETGLDLVPGSLSVWRDEVFSYRDPAEDFHFHVYVGHSAATDADIVVGEGRQIVFVDPAEVESLPKSQSCAYFVTEFLADPAYVALATAPGSSRLSSSDSAMPNASSTQA